MKAKKLLIWKELRSVFGGGDLRRLRNEECFSQEYMAKQLGVTQSTYHRIESGEIKISIERLEKIAKIFDKPFEAFRNIDEFTSGHHMQIIQQEYEQLQITILQQEKRIKELEEELRRSHHGHIEK